jgi:hypothetical protein
MNTTTNTQNPSFEGSRHDTVRFGKEEHSTSYSFEADEVGILTTKYTD